jgi:uncharacterized protein (DUF2267 family)
MATTGLNLLDQAVDEADQWVDEVLTSLDLDLAGRHHAYSALRAVLQAIRDSLDFEEALVFSRELPAVLRGLALEGWKPAQGLLKERTRVAFLTRVAERLVQIPNLQPAAAARAVFGSIARRIKQGAMSDFRSRWPEPLREFWPKEAAA